MSTRHLLFLSLLLGLGNISLFAGYYFADVQSRLLYVL